MNKFKYHFLGALVFLGTLISGFAVYAALNWTNVANVETGNTLTATLWNNTMTSIMNNVDSIETDTNKMGSVVTVWGRDSAPTGSTLLYGGWAYGAHYLHPGGSMLCMKGGDAGGTAAGTTYGDLIYPLHTGDIGRMPPGIAAYKHIACSNVYIKNAKFELWGSHTCPTGWSSLYTGYSMNSYYNHSNRNSTPICVDSTNFNTSISWSHTSGGSFTVGTYLWRTSDANNFPTNRWVKCAVCTKQ